MNVYDLDSLCLVTKLRQANKLVEDERDYKHERQTERLNIVQRFEGEQCEREQYFQN